MTTVVASRSCSSSSASASRQHNKNSNNLKSNNTGRTSPATFGGDASKEIYGHAFLGLLFLLVSLLYLGHDALFYSDPTDDVRKQPAASAATTSETTGTSTTDNMSSSDKGFVYRRVDSGQSDAQVLRYIMERRGGHVHVDLPDKQDTSVSISMEEGMTILSQDTSEAKQMARDISALISNSSFDGVFFEMPGVDSATVSTTPFEFVLVNAPSLAQFAESHPDRYAFEEHLDKCEERQTCCAFDNLGGDARLIAPRMMGGNTQGQPKIAPQRHGSPLW